MGNKMKANDMNETPMTKRQIKAVKHAMQNLIDRGGTCAISGVKIQAGEIAVVPIDREKGLIEGNTTAVHRNYLPWLRGNSLEQLQMVAIGDPDFGDPEQAGVKATVDMETGISNENREIGYQQMIEGRTMPREEMFRRARESGLESQ